MIALFTVQASAYPNLPSSSKEVMAEKLAANKNFKAFVIGNYEVLSKIKEAKAVPFYTKLLNKTASPEEKNLLAQKIGFENFKALNAQERAIWANKPLYQKELEGLTSKDVDEIVSLATSKVISTHYKKPPTTGECWNLWMVLWNGCNGSCLLADDYDDCWWACQGIASATAGVCFLLAD